jgi:NAD(P)-dependent dehydrogenase (short-subunit alcohol dehydrogenase family)
MLNGKVAIVTGSSRGIGATIVQKLSSQGASVVINYPFPDMKEEAKALVKTLQTASIAVEADLSTLEGPKILVDAAVQKFGKIDILVNNASTTILAPLEKCTLEDWDTMLNLNGRGFILTTQAVLPHLNNPSRIVNVISVGSRLPTPFTTIYAATKGLQDVLTKLWARELPPKFGCTVNAVSPGPTRYVPMLSFPNTRTPEFEEIVKNPDAPGHDGITKMMAGTPSGNRLGEPEETAFAVAMLCEDEASWMNGNHIHVNGGVYQG